MSRQPAVFPASGLNFESTLGKTQPYDHARSSALWFYLSRWCRNRRRQLQASRTAGPTPFISFVHLRFDPAVSVSSAKFRIRPKEGSATRPVTANYASAYLEARGYLDNTAGKLTVPVFGLYAGRSNDVTVTVRYADGTSSKVKLAIQTVSYDGGTYSNPVVVQPRLPGTT
jgi:VCBS repeat-containing protein